MTCPACGTENDAGRKFCGECGARLAIACPACGTPNPPPARFCGECGAALGRAPAVSAGAPTPAGTQPASAPVAALTPAPVAERRLVTVLFADLVGFTPFAEGHDAEEVRESLSRYFDLAAEVIARHGGAVEKFIGDAVMAVWGAPVAHEDDAERAVRAGLELLDAIPSLGPGIEARAGLLTGEAAITLGAAGQGMVAGDLVTTASRLQSVTAPGTVLVGEATMRAASRAIAFELAGQQVLKGKSAPVPAWRALRVVAEVGGRGRSDVLEPPFVGRAEELRALKEALHATGRERRPRLVSVSGVAGIGKSRLAWELEKYVDGLVVPVWWHTGRSPAHGEGVASWALGEMVRGRAGLAEADDEPTTRAAVDRMLAEWVPDAEDRRWVEPAVLALLGIAPPPPGGRDVLFAGWRMLFERIAARGTTVLLFEDLQWADDGLLDFIENLLEVARDAPILVVTLARPELVDRRPGWGAVAHAATSLALEPLGAAEMRRLVSGLVPELPERAVAAIVERAAGVPLYTVETIRMLIVDGKLEPAGVAWRPVGEMGELAVPETLRSLVAARLDALDPTDRRLLSDAAVLGGSFTLDALAAVSGVAPEALEPRLRGLVRHELLGLQADPRSPERGKYAFVQALVREVAYGTLARRDRRALHLAAARYLEVEGGEELAGALASHYLAACRASAEGPEADALAAQARVTLTGAARRALDLGAHEQAVVCVEQALPLPMPPGDEAALLEIAARAASLAGDQDAAGDYARRAVTCREAAGDPVATARATALVAVILQRAGRVADAVPHLEEALDARPADGAEEADAVLLAYLSRAYVLTGQEEPCLATAERALSIAERLDLDDLVVEALDNKALALNDLGRRREADALMGGALRLAHELGDAFAEVRARNNLGVILSREDARRSLAIQREQLELEQRLGGLPGLLIAAWNTVASLTEAATDWDEAERLIAELAATTTEPRARADLEDGIPLVRAARGELDAERFAAREARVRDLADPQASATFELDRAEVEWCRGDFMAVTRAGLAAAELLRGKALEGLCAAAWGALWRRDAGGLRSITARLEADPDSSRVAKAMRAATRGALAGLEGRTAESVARHREAIRILREGGFEWTAALVALGFLWVVGPEVPEARSAVEEARTVFERVRARVHLERLDAAMVRTVAEGLPA